MELRTKPLIVAWQRHMTVPMAEENFFSGQENAIFRPFSETTFLMKSLGKRVWYEPPTASLFRWRKGLRGWGVG
tara:strand:- start:2488 stop:2709 length:222 start_codon:yes stop_codon:yes gene_type:complete